MQTADLAALVLACAPQVHPATALALIATESGANPNAIGVVGGRLVRQPRHRQEALATIGRLERGGWDNSVGLAQINRRNFARLGLDAASALDPCANLAAMQTVLSECYGRASRPDVTGQRALRKALSCYYSGDFSTGLRHGYVRKVVGAAAASPSLPVSTSKESP
ncbi:lytic transglycosylase domain-containing protein [Rubrivivax gelatinosus]|uniref:Type IV secretion system protein VirB1 n=1 Tax=Rubrivivax gelatinosus TaxID=28068 RepID=A0A4R2MF92_RUBGE|nr:lytic transglycosylase domain-containing protein [Rubrivivax gelatinosus]MBK1687794.1 lytic transglycosylase [Rubrivivax gelatinosus]TCP03417.1 type IV secretion system protein VirB1 [Rubrivivax gelatinosus]